MPTKNKTIKLVSILLIICIIIPAVLFSKPKKADAVITGWVSDFFAPFTGAATGSSAVSNTTSTAVVLKNVVKEIGRQILMTIAKRFLQEMTKSTVNWINTGNWGNPLFVENPQSFFTDIAKYEIRNIVTTYGYDRVKFPFGRDFSLNIINSYKRQAAENAEYTLSRVFNDPVLLRNYQTNFDTGGWNGFLTNTQYPQNNYIGYTMVATEELARRLDGVVQTNAEKVRTTLDQGMGFLSPKTCPPERNPRYNNGVNEFRKPSFTTSLPYNPPPRENYASDDEWGQAMLAYEEIYQGEVASERSIWAETNTCPGGLVSTTPGSVVANQITQAMGSKFRETELAGAMGNSISAILDAFINRFINKGLTSLATTVSPEPVEDDFSYEGQTLGSPNESGTNFAWNSGPDEPIILVEFKKQLSGKTLVKDENGVLVREEIGRTGNGEYIPGDIANTEAELRILSNKTDNINEMGITQMFGYIWPKTRELDFCVPGPNLLWQERLDKEMNREGKQLSGKTNDSDGKKAAQAELALRELKFAVNSFKDWINNKMLLELPGSVFYMEAVDEIEDLYQQSDELTDKSRSKTQAVARLNAIKISLNSMSVQPEPGSAQEKVLVNLRKQYLAVKPSISNTVSIEDMRSEQSATKEKYIKLTELLAQCNQERIAKGWTVPGGSSSRLTVAPGAYCTENSAITVTDPPPATMTPGQAYPITIRVANAGESYWYNGDVFSVVKKSGNLSTPAPSAGLPYPISANLADPTKRYAEWTFNITAPSTPGDYSFDLQMVHRSGNPYLRLLDDTTNPGRTENCSNKTPTSNAYFGDTTTIRVAVAGNRASYLDPIVTPSPPPEGNTGFTTSGKEQDLFCNMPIKGGYTHDTFVNRGVVAYPELPLVNARDVLKWRRWGGIFGNYTADIELKCDLFYKSTILDYKQNLPGVTTIVEPYEPYDGSGAGEPDDECPGPALPLPPGSAPNMEGIVRDVDQEFPGLITQSEENFDFLDEVVNRLNAADSNFGYNGKRGTSDLSTDAIAYKTGTDTEVHIFDIISASGTPGAAPAWQDVTDRTYTCGGTGRYIYPR